MEYITAEIKTVGLLRTVEEVLGLKPLNLKDAFAVPLTDVFTDRWLGWSSSALPSPLLTQTKLPIDGNLFSKIEAVTVPYDARYWAVMPESFDFSVEDRMNFAKYNLVFWRGLMVRKP